MPTNTTAVAEIISVRGLRKSFKGKRGKGKAAAVEAVRGVDLAVREGEIFGFLGPNGAGKSTTLRILSTLLAADAGEVTIAGFDVRTSPARVRRSIGYVSQAGGADPLATGRENLLLQARLYGLEKTAALRRSQELIESLGLSQFVDRFVKTYSGGQRRKLDIAIGMVHQPEDPVPGRADHGPGPREPRPALGQIRLLRDLGTTVFLTTHYMEEADALCDRISIIDRGRIVAEGTPVGAEGRHPRRHPVPHGEPRCENAPEVALGRPSRPGLSSARRRRTAASLRLVVSRGGEALPVVLRLLEGGASGWPTSPCRGLPWTTCFSVPPGIPSRMKPRQPWPVHPCRCAGGKD